MKWKRFRNRQPEPGVRLNVGIYQQREVLLTLQGTDPTAKVEMPLSPAEARTIAAHLLLNARSLDPVGHAPALADIEQQWAAGASDGTGK